VTRPVFFADPDRLRAAQPGDVIALDGAEGRHAAKVRRLGLGEGLDLADGAGLICTAEVSAVRGEWLEARVRTCMQLEAPRPRIVVVQALAKGDRDERAVETMTEVGVDVIVPWQASRSIVRWDAQKAVKGVDRWRATAREAAKQARRPWLPEIAELETTEGIVGRLAVASGCGVVLHEAASEPLAALAIDAAVAEFVVVVGPEGGIADDEVAAFEAVGARAYRLGPTVLRTSTAGTVAAALLMVAAGRWG